MMRRMSRLQLPSVAVVGAVLADGTTEQVRSDVTLLVDENRIAGLWFDGGGPDPDELDAPVIDGSGCSIVPGMVDSHAHLSMPGGAQWIERGRVDATDELLAGGEE